MTDQVAGVLLAGGLSRRMGGGDKSLRSLGGRPILDHVVERVRHQVGPLLLNANGEAGRFADYGLPVRSDVLEGFAGPLAGVLTGMEWAAEAAPACRWLVSFACDAPFLPQDLVEGLRKAVEDQDADLACARSRGRSHPVFGLWRIDLRKDLRQAMVKEEIRKVDRWTARYRLVVVDFPDIETPRGPVDPFFNTNNPEDIAEAESFLGVF
jgi:molybdopterin-guanine dinucleotide biosynthesis protein A